jgi:hypothetical protein
MSNVDKFVDWTEENFDYVRYNPRKEIDRWGLSITSLDGGLSGTPDLDSLPNYNKENNTQYYEQHFKTPTPVYDFPSVKEVLDPIKDYICRTHVLKLNSGGYFPPHRDFTRDIFKTYRLIIPLRNIEPPCFNFVIEDKIQNFKKGVVYFVDTAKMHYLFNASQNPSYMIVVNVIINKETVEFVTNNFLYP